ncbi:lipid kinase [Myxosarcina sp. GI1]|uniref:lipid kinase n=1 Tax=Myxosarcina sp. GI1 TaxID=1541065 RepID=UPI00056221D9|nr:lipid kinase [Myxosarcina sp. GI1]
MSKRALLSINSHARNGKNSLKEAVAALENSNFELVVEPDLKPDELAKLIVRQQHQLDIVIIGGGDGTLNAVAASLVKTELPLGIIPLGTANDLARTLKIPESIAEAVKIIADGKLQYIDLGCVNDKYFFNVASLGLSVKITQNLSKGAKRRWGIFAYLFTAFKVIIKVRPFRAEVRYDDRSFKIKTLQIAIGNGRYYGGGMSIAEDAAIDDELLNLYSLEIKHWWQILPIIFKLRGGENQGLSGVRTYRGKKIEVYTRHPQTINTDGELTTATPATFRVIPKAIAVFVP